MCSNEFNLESSPQLLFLIQQVPSLSKGQGQFCRLTSLQIEVLFILTIELSLYIPPPSSANAEFESTIEFAIDKVELS